MVRDQALRKVHVQLPTGQTAHSAVKGVKFVFGPSHLKEHQPPLSCPSSFPKLQLAFISLRTFYFSSTFPCAYTFIGGSRKREEAFPWENTWEGVTGHATSSHKGQATPCHLVMEVPQLGVPLLPRGSPEVPI